MYLQTLQDCKVFEVFNTEYQKLTPWSQGVKKGNEYVKFIL